eukprot:s4727_g3.t3
MFAKQREEMKAAGKLDGLREKLQAISKKYSGAFRLPPYFTLILRAFGTLEGLGLKTNENFAIVKDCFPYIARRLITDDSFRMREALRSYLYKGRSRIAVSRIDELATGFGNFTNLMKGSRTESAAAGGIQIEKNGTHEQSNGQSNGRVREVDSATREIAEVVFSPDGNFLQDLLIEEGVAAIDALSRASLVRLIRTLGPLALPLALPLNFLLGGADDQQLLSREDKQSLLVLRRITELVDAGRRPAESDEAEAAADFGETVRSLQRLQPIAQGLLPSITPGAASFAGSAGFATIEVFRLRRPSGALPRAGQQHFVTCQQLWLIAQHMLELPLPPQWSMEEGYMGQIYFFNCVAGETWDCIPLCAAVSTCIVTAPERVSADVSAQEAAQTFVQAVAENKDFLVSSAGFGVSVASAVWTYRQVQEAERATAEAKRQAEEAFKQSDEYKVIHRKVMHAIADRVKTWDEHATIISCRFQTGKTVAVEEILRGAQGIFKHAVKDEHWEEKLT